MTNPLKNKYVLAAFAGIKTLFKATIILLIVCAIAFPFYYAFGETAAPFVMLACIAFGVGVYSHLDKNCMEEDCCVKTKNNAKESKTQTGAPKKRRRNNKSNQGK